MWEMWKKCHCHATETSNFYQKCIKWEFFSPLYLMNESLAHLLLLLLLLLRISYVEWEKCYFIVFNNILNIVWVLKLHYFLCAHDCSAVLAVHNSSTFAIVWFGIFHLVRRQLVLILSHYMFISLSHCTPDNACN